MLERRGFKDREWAVEWEASALEFLLEKGFSPEMGARPLKRAIDQYVIAPLGRDDCGEAVPRGRSVRVRTQRRARHPGRVRRSRRRDDPSRRRLKPPSRRAAGAPVDDAGPERQRCGARRARDGERGRRGDDASRGMGAAKERLSAAMQDDAGLLVAARPLRDARPTGADGSCACGGGDGQSLRSTRLAQGTERAGKSSRELIARLALQLHLVKEGIRDACDGERPLRSPLLVEPAFEKPGDTMATRVWCGAAARYVSRVGRNRNMQLTEIPPPIGGGALPLLLISGFGAHRLLAREVGLHVLELADDGSPGPRDGPRARRRRPTRRARRPTGCAARSRRRSTAPASAAARSCAATGRPLAARARYDGRLAQRPFRCRACAATST